MEGLLSMSAKERERYRLVQAVLERRVRQAQVSERLGVSVRQIKRWVRAVREGSAAGLVSRKRGLPSKRRVDEAEREALLSCVRGRYAGFGPPLAAEYLRDYHEFSRSVEALRQWMVQAELWKPRRPHKKRVFQLRERRACVGERVQIDGSPHAWLEDREPRGTLLAFIDDATGRLQ
jgi:transposase